MNQLMNIYEANEPVYRVHGKKKNMALFFFFEWYKTLFLGSLMFICFINLTTRMEICQVVRQVCEIYRYFMNLMNIYEVRVFNRFFEMVRFFDVDFMNMKMSQLHKCS